MTVAE
jgi:hypothetical protein